MGVIAWAGLVVILIVGHGFSTARSEHALASAPASATTEQTARAAETTGGADSAQAGTEVIRAGVPKMVCIREKVMGSIRPRTICRTRRQIEADREGADYYMRNRDTEGIPEADNRSFER